MAVGRRNRTSCPASRMLLCTAAVLALGGCDPAGSGSGPDQTAADLATLVPADRPEVTIGVAKGKTPYLLSGVADATLQSDGTVVVADCTSSEIRFFDDGGRFLGAVGGHGEGPGEFTLLRNIFRVVGDTIGVGDGFIPRITILAPGSGVVRTVPLNLGIGATVLGAMSNGSFVARRWDTEVLVEVGGHPRSTVSLLLFDASGNPVDSLIGLPGADARESDIPGIRTTSALRLRRQAVFAVQPGGVFYGAQDQAGIIEFDETLTRAGTLTTLTRPEPVTEDVRQAFEAVAALGGHDDPPDGLTSGAPPPAQYAPLMPAFRDLVYGRDGRLWVQDPLRPTHYPLVWTAYGEGGEPVARVELPPRFFPFEFGRDWVLGVSFDERTIERVELWRLVPGQLPGLLLPPRDAQPPHVARCGAASSR